MNRIPLKKQYHTSKVLEWLHCKSYRAVLFLTQKQCQHWDIYKKILTVLLTKIFIMLSLHSFGYVTSIFIFLTSITAISSYLSLVNTELLFTILMSCFLMFFVTQRVVLHVLLPNLFYSALQPFKCMCIFYLMLNF